MGTHVSVSLPLLPGKDCRENVGPWVQYMSHYASELTSLGIPCCDGEGNFTHSGGDPDFEATLGRLSARRDELWSKCRGDDDSELYAHFEHIEEWWGMYNIVVQLRAHGLAADVAGG